MAEPQNGFEYLKSLHEKDVGEKRGFYELQKYLDMKAREKGIPIYGQFELTPLCNFDCRMCYAHLTKRQLKDDSILTVDQWKEIIRQVWEMGMIRATLTGGECLSYPGFKELYIYLHSLGCEVTVFTNGYLLDQEWIDFFTKHQPTCIRITLYGESDDTYERVTGHRAFARVLNNIERINEAGLPLGLSITPNRFMGESVFETVRLAKKVSKSLNINTSIFAPREETGRAGQKDDVDTDHYVRIYKLLDELEGRETIEISEDQLPPIGGPHHECSECGVYCGAGRSSFVIDWRGTLTACNRLRNVTAYPLKDGFKNTWNTVNQMAANWPRVPECKDCPYASVCSLCAASMLECAEPGKQPLQMCERVRDLVKNGVWRIPECD